MCTLGEDGGDRDNPVRPDGYLRPEWVSGGSARSPDRLTRWAATALAAAHRQRELLSRLRVDGNPLATAWSESAAELLCSELATNGLPVDRDRAEQLISSVVGPRPHSAEDTSMLRARRDAGVLQHVGGPDGVDLRNPAQVRAMLAGLGFEVPDTRSSRLEALRGAHPVIEAYLHRVVLATGRFLLVGYPFHCRLPGKFGKCRRVACTIRARTPS